MSDGPGGSEFLSTVTAQRGDYRLALGLVIVSALVFLAAAPFAKLQLPAISAFLPAYQSALVINDLITAALLFGQFNILRYRALLVLGCAYTLSALMAAAHMASFPGLFSPGGLLGAGPQTTAWLYFLWHGAFPLMVIAYAMLKGEAVAKQAHRPRRDILLGIAATVAAAGLLVAATTAGHDLFPPLMQGNQDASGKFVVAFITWSLCVLALYMLWRRGRRSVLDLWLMAVMVSWIFGVALAAVLNAGRFDLGWYMGRAYGLLSSSFVLVVMLLENSMLYARLAGAHRELGDLNKELETFSYSVSHDLGRPLRAVDGYARMLEEDYQDKLDGDGRRMLGVLRTEAQRMGRLIQDLLEFSRLGRQPLRRADFDTTQLVEEVLAELELQAGGDEAAMRASVRRAALPPTNGDAALLRQVWANLLANAIKYSSRNPRPVVEVGSFEEGGLTVFYVKDNGAGFDMRYYDKLFGVFQRLHGEDQFPGTGVGLAIVQKIVSRHGGAVWAQGAVDQGATFFFSIPSGDRARKIELSHERTLQLAGMARAVEPGAP